MSLKGTTLNVDRKGSGKRPRDLLARSDTPDSSSFVAERRDLLPCGPKERAEWPKSEDLWGHHEKDFISQSLLIHRIVRTLSSEMKKLSNIGLPFLLSRGLLAAGIFAFVATSVSQSIPDQDTVDSPIGDFSAVSAEVPPPDQADVDLELDFRTVLALEGWSLVPTLHANDWGRSAASPTRDSTPLSLLLVATQATTTYL
jgi:hypothetical protein